MLRRPPSRGLAARFIPAAPTPSFSSDEVRLICRMLFSLLWSTIMVDPRKLWQRKPAEVQNTWANFDLGLGLAPKKNSETMPKKKKKKKFVVILDLARINQ